MHCALRAANGCCGLAADLVVIARLSVLRRPFMVFKSRGFT
jgi:hypothetical protein